MLYRSVVDKINTIESVSPCSKQYSFKTDLKLNAWFGVAAVVALGVQLLLRQNPEWSGPTRASLALTPMVPGLLYVWSCVRFIGGMDELQRRIQLEALLFATLGTVGIGTVINVLNANGVSFARFQHGLELGSAFVLMFALWVLGCVVANCRYK
jgi:hypothetical protein